MRVKVQVPGGNFKSIQTGGSTTINNTIVQGQSVVAPAPVVPNSATNTTPGGSDTYVQYNKSGAFFGDSNFTWNYTDQFLTIKGASASSPAILVIEASSNAPWAIDLRRTDLTTADDVLMFNNGGVLQIDNTVIAPSFESNATAGNPALLATLTSDMYLYSSEALSAATYGTWWSSGTKGSYGGFGIDDGSYYPVFMSAGTAAGIYLQGESEWIILYESTGITIGAPIVSGTWEATAIGTTYGGTGINGSAAGDGKLLIGNGSGYTLANLTAGSGVTITNGAGTISIAVGGVGSVVANSTSSASLTSSGTALPTLALPAAGTYLVEINLYASASTSSTLAFSSAVSTGSITAETGGVFRTVNASNTVDTYSVNICSSGAKSIFSSATQTIDGWGIIAVTAASTLTITGTAASSDTVTCGYIGVRATRLA